MRNKVWELLKKRFKTEKGIQTFIMEGVGMALTIIGLLVFLLVLTAIKRSLGI